MADATIFIMDNENRIRICSAWSRTSGDATKVVDLTELEEDFVNEEIAILKGLGILLDGGKLDEKAERYVNSYVTGKSEDAKL